MRRPSPSEYHESYSAYVDLVADGDVLASRQGIASGWTFTVRTFPWIIAGHELHHRVRLERDYLGVGA